VAATPTSGPPNAWAGAECRIPLAVAARPDLPASAKVLYGLILWHDRSPDGCFASIRTLAREVGLKRRQVVYTLSTLVGRGLIRVDAGRGRRNRVFVLPLPVHSSAPVQSNALHPCTPVHPTHAVECTPPMHSSARASEEGREEGIEVGKEEGRLHQPLRVDGWFADFWALYPRKVAKKAAAGAFLKAVRSEARWRKVKAALEAQLPGLLAREPEKRPHPATWLNQERWNDEPDPPAQGAVPSRQESREADIDRKFRERMMRHLQR